MFLPQAQLADKLGITQQSFAGWERRETALKPDQLARLADVLGVTTEHLLGTGLPPKRGTGPAGKARQVFERVSKLPRSRQQKIIEVVEALLKAG